VFGGAVRQACAVAGAVQVCGPSGRQQVAGSTASRNGVRPGVVQVVGPAGMYQAAAVSPEYSRWHAVRQLPGRSPGGAQAEETAGSI